MQLKIGQKLLIALLGITILSTAAVFIFGYIVSSRSLAGKVEEELRLSLKRSSGDVDNFLQDQQSEARALAEMPWLKELLGSLKSGNHGGFIKNRGLMEQFFLNTKETERQFRQ